MFNMKPRQPQRQARKDDVGQGYHGPDPNGRVWGCESLAGNM